MFMQDLWRAGLGWDVDLPSFYARRWTQFREDIRDIATIKLSRWLGWTPSSQVQLHAFADASRRAMAAVVYLRIQDADGTVRINLVASKTKLTPIRSLKSPTEPSPRMTIPRLELRAALLAAKLVKHVASSINVSLEHCYAWSNSQITLRWLRSSDSLKNNLVDSYVSHIQELLPQVAWRYVSTEVNPADLATRGTTAGHLRESQLWWRGPQWLRDSNDLWPITEPTSTNINCFATLFCEPDIIERFSWLGRMLRILTRCRRWLHQFRDRAARPSMVSPLTAAELQVEFLHSARRSQRKSFPTEIGLLEKGKPVPESSSLRTLDPFIDPSGTLRVGGRLENSSLPYEEKHPVILSSDCHLASLIIDWAHHRALHAGFRLTSTFVNQRAWIVGGKPKIKDRIRTCNVCARLTARPMDQAMAALPSVRVTPSRPFTNTGVDYAGPFTVLRSKGRGLSRFKGYVAIFVCMATKAVHLEPVGDLTTASFLGALTRFSSRRGIPRDM